MKNLFKSIIVGSFLTSIVFNAEAFSTSLTLSNSVFTNFSAMLPGSVRVTQVIVSASSTNTTAIQLVDTSTNTLVQTNAAYIATGSYLTNYTQIITNYYGNIQTNTNTWQVEYSVTNAASTNNLNVPFSVQVTTNGTMKFDTVNYYFTRGLWITNSGSGPATVTITYQP